MREVSLTVVFVLLIAGQASAQEQIFSDDFEWGSICAWSNLWYQDNDNDQWGANGVSGIQVSCPAPAGYVTIKGDCDDTDDLINPGAFDISASGVDENCDGQLDEPISICDAGLPSNASNAESYAAAAGLCRLSARNPRGWGVVDGQLTLPDGTGSPSVVSRSIRPDFGATTPRQGSSIIVLSTGTAAASVQTNPNHGAFQPGTDAGTSSGSPTDWLTANGGVLPNAPGCPAPYGGSTAFDGVMLSLEIKVPSNANSFSFSSNFFSAEYPEWVCSPYNDFFVVLLDSSYNGIIPNPADKNLAQYWAPSSDIYPIGVNLAFGDTGLFRQCLNGPTGCTFGSVSGTVTSCVGIFDLIGTGMDVANPPPVVLTDFAWCGSSNLAGGATGWLTTSGNVVPGEVITLRIAIWDTGDHLADSTVLIDNFQWSVDASSPGTVLMD